MRSPRIHLVLALVMRSAVPNARAFFLVTALSAGLAFANDDINEGELRFLDTPPEQAPHHQTKHVTITGDSLTSGWVTDSQCHYNLDPVPALQIVFGTGRVRNLKVVRYDDIGRAWVEGESVQMENVGANAFICIESQNRLLKRDDKEPNRYLLLSGPYMRRFLDGFFPMKVNLIVDYPDALLRYTFVAPPSVEPYIRTAPGRIEMDTLFEGQLLIGLGFSGK